MGVTLQVENVVMKTDARRAFDIDDLVRYSGAFRDIGFAAAKFCYSRTAGRGRRDEDVTVNVYPSGKLVCVGAKSVQQAREHLGLVLGRLGVTEYAEPTLHMVNTSGHFEDHIDIHRAIPYLKEYHIMMDTGVFAAVMIVRDGVLMQVFADTDPVKITCRGPDLETIESVVNDLYGTVLRANSPEA